jgi:hypothetical protein
VTGRSCALAVALVSSAGCGMTRLQTARTVPRGETQQTIGISLVHAGDRGLSAEGVPIIPVDFMVRHGFSDHVDMGIRTFFAIGMLGDLKWNLLSPERRTALSISGGFGFAAADGAVIHVPLTLCVSHAVRPWFTPYAAVGYGTYWILDYSSPQPGVSYAPRTGTGDGLLMLHAGVELSTWSGRGVMFEYSVGFPVVDDPGDFFEFATNQFFSIAFHTGRGYGPTMSR